MPIHLLTNILIISNYFLFAFATSGDPALVLGDATRMRDELHWTPKYDDLSEMLLTAWRWRQIAEADDATQKKQT